MSVSVFSFFLELFNAECFRGMYLNFKKYFWSKNYDPELILNNFLLKATSKSQVSIWQGTTATK